MTRQRSSQRFCHKCGAEIHPASTYCRVCGYRKADRTHAADGPVKG